MICIFLCRNAGRAEARINSINLDCSKGASQLRKEGTSVSFLPVQIASNAYLKKVMNCRILMRLSHISLQSYT